MSSLEELEARLEAGDLARALDSVTALDVKSRKAALAVAVARSKAWFKGDFVETGRDGPATSFTYAWQGTDEQRAAAKLTALALGEPQELTSAFRASKRVDLVWGLDALPILERFEPGWLAQRGVDVLFDAELLSFDLVRALRERGRCPQLQGERYAVAIIASARVYHREKTFLDVLDEHPRFVREDLRLIFGVEGTSEHSLAALDKYSKGTGGWSRVLLTLLERGEFSRSELLDITLEVLSRGYASFKAGWYSRFHEELSPALEERATRQADYERLLGSAVPQTASFALKALEVLQKARALRAPSFVDAIEPVLSAAQGDTVKRALRMLSALGRAGAAEKDALAGLSLLALSHPDAAVQAAAVELFRESGGFAHAELVERLQAAAPALAPSVREGIDGAGATDGSPAPLPVSANWVALDPLAPERALQPSDSLEAALQRMSRALEHPDDVESFELALDAASRFGAAPQAELARLGGPLRKRTTQLLARGVRDTLQFELLRVANAWVGKEHQRHPHEDISAASGLARFAWSRTDALIARLLAGRGGPLLSAPSHQHGHLAEGELERRLALHEGPVDIEEAVLALLRLPMTTAPRWLEPLSARVTDGRAALESAARALGGERVRPRVLRWGEQYVWHRVLVDVAPPPAPQHRADLPEHLLEVMAEEKGAHGLERWLPLGLPRASEWVSAAEALQHGGYGFDEVARTGDLLCWRDPSVEPGPNAYFALAVALGTRSASIGLSARDVLLAELATGRLRPERLGQAFTVLLTSGLIKVGRWHTHLTEVAAASPSHARAIWIALLGSLRGSVDAFPRDFSKLLGLAKELQIGLGESCRDEQARAWLSSVKRGGQLAKHAAALLT